MFKAFSTAIVAATVAFGAVEADAKEIRRR